MTLLRFIAIFLFCSCLGFVGNAALAARVSKDQLGRHVVLPETPQRVVSLAPGITEIIFALKRENRLKGVTLHSDFPVAARRLPKVGSYVGLDLEKIVALNPDLCIAIKDGNPKRVIDRLESLSIPVYAVNPTNLASVMEAILAVGDLLNAKETANRLVQGMRSRINTVKSLVASAPDRPRVFFQIGASPIISVGTRTYIHELILLAGGENVTAGDTPYPRNSREQIILLAPEIIIITTMTKDHVARRIVAKWNQWPQIPAVRNRRIYIANSDLFDRPSFRLVDGLEALAELIHPELFENKLK